MKGKEAKITHKYLLRFLDYNPETGEFVWREITSNRVKIGMVAGQVKPDEYRYINLNGSRYSAHRLAWFYVHARWPENEIDHINLNPVDNRISNLREATHTDNARNVRRRKHNTSGYKGVASHNASGGFIAQISVNGRTKYLGYFKDPEAAHAAYVDASIKYHGEFGRPDNV